MKLVPIADHSKSPGKLQHGLRGTLASHPRFILADEPTANLDSASARNLLEIMEKLNQEEKVTFIFPDL